MAEMRQRHRPHDGASARGSAPALEAKGPSKPSYHAAAAVPRAGLVVVAFLLFHAAALATVNHFHTWLPPPQPLDAPSHAFSEARARVVLDKIMSFGYRPVGSKANDELTPAYLLSEVRSNSPKPAHPV
jgi:hypothetical protein